MRECENAEHGRACRSLGVHSKQLIIKESGSYTDLSQTVDTLETVSVPRNPSDIKRAQKHI